jgi:hypothetical protein
MLPKKTKYMILIWFRGSMTGIKKNESLCLTMQQIHLANMLCCKRGKKITNTTSIKKIRGKKRKKSRGAQTLMSACSISPEVNLCNVDMYRPKVMVLNHHFVRWG